MNPFENIPTNIQQDEKTKLNECKVDFIKLWNKINNLQPETKKAFASWGIKNAELFMLLELIRNVDSNSPAKTF